MMMMMVMVMVMEVVVVMMMMIAFLSMLFCQLESLVRDRESVVVKWQSLPVKYPTPLPWWLYRYTNMKQPLKWWCSPHSIGASFSGFKGMPHRGSAGIV
jgi:hypothetical protein